MECRNWARALAGDDLRTLPEESLPEDTADFPFGANADPASAGDRRLADYELIDIHDDTGLLAYIEKHGIDELVTKAFCGDLRPDFAAGIAHHPPDEQRRVMIDYGPDRVGTRPRGKK